MQAVIGESLTPGFEGGSNALTSASSHGFDLRLEWGGGSFFFFEGPFPSARY